MRRRLLYFSTNSKAVGHKTDGFALSLRDVFSHGIVRVSKLVVKRAAAIFTSVPARASPPRLSKGTPQPTKKQ
jgi:hypothetical protein